MNHSRRMILKLLGLPVLLLALTGIYLAGLQLTGNFYEVLPGQLYRAAQVTPDSLARYHRDYGIKTVINLRGAKPGSAWYDAEIRESKALGIRHVDFAMQAKRELTDEQARALVALMRDAPKPILLHCKSGSDRTGLASALYLGAIAGATESHAEGQLSLRFGHVGIPFLSPTFAMDESWERLESWLGYAS